MARQKIKVSDIERVADKATLADLIDILRVLAVHFGHECDGDVASAFGLIGARCDELLKTFLAPRRTKITGFFEEMYGER